MIGQVLRAANAIVLRHLIARWFPGAGAAKLEVLFEEYA